MSNGQERDDESAWFWYEKLQEHENSRMSVKHFCELHNLSAKKFYDYRFLIRNVSDSKPNEYHKRKQIFEEFEKSDLNSVEFAKSHNLERTQIVTLKSHFNFLKQIERIKKEKQLIPNNPKPEMNFIQIPSIKSNESEITLETPSRQYHEPKEPQLIPKQNDIEIVISKGVKVSISPTLDSMKIIKIIELLKDL